MTVAVKAVVLEVDAASKKLKLGMKPSYFIAQGNKVRERESEEEAPTDKEEQHDLDEDLLEAMGSESDEDSDWRDGQGIPKSLKAMAFLKSSSLI